MGVKKVLHSFRYAAWLFGQVLVASTSVVADNLRIRQRQRPVLIGLPVRVTSDWDVAVFAESITMTPGTLVCGVRELEDDSFLFIVHAIFGADLPGLYDSLYDMEEHLCPQFRDVARPEGFVFEEYDPTVQVDPDAVVGTALERERGLPLPEGMRVKPSFDEDLCAGAVKDDQSSEVQR